MEQENGHCDGAAIRDQWIPVFPLPNVVLMPRHILPLHIFEPRYRAMTHDALAGSRLISIALLRNGYEPKYHTLEAPIHEIVCVGEITRNERLPDGRYNILLQGLKRARIVAENSELTYRRAKMEPLEPRPLPCEVELELRRSIVDLLGNQTLAELAKQGNWTSLLEHRHASFSDLVDALAASVLICPDEKQCFLELVCAAKRARYLCATLQSMQCRTTAPPPHDHRPRKWPPGTFDN